MEDTELFNLEFYKKSHKEFEKHKKNLFNFLIRDLSREFILEALRKKKLIERDWANDHTKFIEKKNEQL